MTCTLHTPPLSRHLCTVATCVMTAILGKLLVKHYIGQYSANCFVAPFRTMPGCTHTMALTRPGVTSESPASALTLVLVRVECGDQDFVRPLVTGHWSPASLSWRYQERCPRYPRYPVASFSHLRTRHTAEESCKSPAHSRPANTSSTPNLSVCIVYSPPPECCHLLHHSLLPMCLHQCSAARLASPDSVQEGAVV